MHARLSSVSVFRARAGRTGLTLERCRRDNREMASDENSRAREFSLGNALTSQLTAAVKSEMLVDLRETIFFESAFTTFM